ncbi:GCN5 family acetyltransferase [alpha proteobacterium AAP81b]|nr:GCN5 family acetyltransferase [alpha proteobacterium AAP81b]
MHIRAETPADHAAIAATAGAAFAAVAHSAGTEPAIIAALRDADALTISLVACEGDTVVGHVAFSPVAIAASEGDWFGLGPVSVLPTWQGSGIGSALITEGLAQLKALGAAGCVVLGDPRYYRRFGFTSDPTLTYGDFPAGLFQRLVFGEVSPSGAVAYHPAFAAT